MIPWNVYDRMFLQYYQLAALFCKLIDWMSKHKKFS